MLRQADKKTRQQQDIGNLTGLKRTNERVRQTNSHIGQKEVLLERLNNCQSGVHADLHLGLRGKAAQQKIITGLEQQVRKSAQKSAGKHSRDPPFTKSPLSPQSVSSLPINFVQRFTEQQLRDRAKKDNAIEFYIAHILALYSENDQMKAELDKLMLKVQLYN